MNLFTSIVHIRYRDLEWLSRVLRQLSVAYMQRPIGNDNNVQELYVIYEDDINGRCWMNIIEKYCSSQKYGTVDLVHTIKGDQYNTLDELKNYIDRNM